MAADEDADVFEITDFTTASEWERFVARLEEILHEWKLVSHRPRQPMTKAEQNSGTWVEKSEEVTFADYGFIITHSYLRPSAPPGQNVGHQQSPDDDMEEEEEKEDTIPTVMLDMMNTENDFPSKAHNLSRLYGLQDFVVLTPANPADPIESESRIKMVLSSISVALNNAGCPVPLFVQIKQPWRNMFTGTCLLPGATIEYDVIHLNRVPAQYNHLAGLLDVFKAKLATQVSPRPTVTVAVRFTYFLQEWVNSPWPQEPPVSTLKNNVDLSSPLEDEVGCTSFGVLPFGAEEDPVSELRLACTWPSLSEDMIVENQNYSDLDPLQAPQWSVKIIMTDDPNCLLGQYLTSFLKHCYRPESTDDLLWNFIAADEENEQGADLSQALQKITEPKVAYNIPSLSNVVNRTTTRVTVKSGEAPISGQTLNDILEFLFPDAKDVFDKAKEEQEKEEKESDATESAEQSDNRYAEVLRDLSKHLKSAPEDTLLHKLAVSLCIINIHNGGLRGVAQLWQEFVLEMRYRWENKFFIKGIHPGSPNLGSCLLYQKLQMLNCCIERKMKREQLYKGYTGDLESSQEEGQGHQSDNQSKSNKQKQTAKKHKKLVEQRSQSDSSVEENPSKVLHLDVCSSSEDEFFECDDVEMEVDHSEKDEGEGKQEEGDASNKEEGVQLSDIERKTSIQEDSADSMASSGSLVYTDSVTHKPEGRLAPFGELKLRETNEQMYIPITQEPAPMTEDMLEEQAEVLARLGTSSEGAQLRARMQSACLVSDMESFKGANPGCTIEDFVRWYSPRDWVEEEVQDENGQTVIKGHLSQRMQIPGNVWVEVWQGAKPVPARRQKRLFDDTKEAEKVLHFLASMKPSSLVLHLMPVLVHAAIVKVVENEDSDIPRLKEVIDQLVNKGAKVTRAARQDVKKYEDLVRFINLAETMIARAKSLKSKFTKDLLEQKNAEQEMDSFVAELLHHQEVNVRGGPYGPAGSIIHKLFIAAQKEINMLVDDNKDEKSDDGRSSAVSDFPRPTGREYILRTFAPRPAPYSKSLPQRMYCNIMEGIEFRLAGAFSTDTTFQ